MSDDDCSSSAAWHLMLCEQQVSHPTTIKWCLKAELAPQPLGEGGTTRRTR